MRPRDNTRKTLKNLGAKQKPRPFGRGFCEVLFLDLLMLALHAAPLAILLELDLSSDELLVLATPVVYALTGSTG